MQIGWWFYWDLNQPYMLYSNLFEHFALRGGGTQKPSFEYLFNHSQRQYVQRTKGWHKGATGGKAGQKGAKGTKSKGQGCRGHKGRAPRCKGAQRAHLHALVLFALLHPSDLCNLLAQRATWETFTT